MKAAIIIIILVLLASPVNAAWLVTWVVEDTYGIACPDSEPSIDKFGRVTPGSTIALACVEVVHSEKYKFFNESVEATAFITDGQKRGDRLFQSKLKHFKLFQVNEVK